MIELAPLRLALFVLDHGSFRKAAMSFNVRPSVVSRRIRSLEDELGVSLFQRRSQGVQPTLAGQRVLSRARILLNEIDNLFRSATRYGTGAEGRLCIGVNASIAGGTAHAILASFIAGHPDVEIDVVEGSPIEHLAKIRAFHMDVVLKAGTEPIPDLDVEPLWSEPIHVALSRSDALASAVALRWDQLTRSRFIVTKMDSGPEIEDCVIMHLAGFGRSPKLETRAVRREGLLALVGLGLGITLVGTAETAVSYPDVVFRPLGNERLSFSAVWSAGNDNPALRRFLSLARAQTRGLLAPLLDGRPGAALSQTPDLSP